MAIDTLSLDFGRDKPFYVYIYRDPRPRKKNCPIYVGKGTAARGRADSHWLKGSQNLILNSIMRKIRASGLAPGIEIVAWFDFEAAAFALEVALIKRFGRRANASGPLANLTDGGEGASGWIPTEDFRAGARIRMQARWDNPDQRVEMARKVGKSAAIGAAAALAAWNDENKRPEMIKTSEPGRIAAMAASSLAWSDPDKRAARIEKMKAGIKAAWADPIKGARMLAATRASRAAELARRKSALSTS